MKNRKNVFKAVLSAAMVILAFFVLSMLSYASESEIIDGYYEEEEAEYLLEYTDSYEFTGEQILPVFGLYLLSEDGEKTALSRETDYEVDCDHAVYPDSYECCITPAPNSPYDFDYVWFNFEIFFEETKIFVEDIPDVYYTGKEVIPAIKAYYDGKPLGETFYYADYDYADSHGVYTVYLTFFDQYETEKTYKIKRVPVSNLTFSSVSDTTYNGSTHCPVPKITYNGMTLSQYSDFSVKYKNNKNAGTASLIVTMKDNFTGSKTIEFKIKPYPVSKIKVEKISDMEYTGKALKPYIYAYCDWGYFYSDDFTVKYKNNKYPGKATAVVTFNDPNISGKKTISFQIKVADAYYLDGNTYSDEVDLYWSIPGNCKSILYKYSASKKKYVAVDKKSTGSYIDKNVKEFTTYKYKLRTYVKADGKTYYGDYVSFSVKTGLFSPKNVRLAVKKGCITVKWDKNKSADGYIVYRYDVDNGKNKKLYKTTKNTVVKYSDKSVRDYGRYEYWVVAYKKSGKKTIKSTESEYAYSLDVRSVTYGVKLKPKKSFGVYNAQGKKTTLAWTETLSSKDIETLEKFAKKHFTSKMSATEKVRVTLFWIHDNMDYADESSDWNKISDKSYVDAVFNYKLGQCAQYNGALAAMMTYLGFDVKLIQGYRGNYRGSQWQHFWVECKLNGLTYLMECGNKDDGYWYYFFAPFKYTSGYMKNGKFIDEV